MNYQAREVLTVPGQSLVLFLGASTISPAVSKIGFGISGTWTGGLGFEGSFDGVRYVPLDVTAFPPASGLAVVQSTTINGNFYAGAKNLQAVRISGGSIQTNNPAGLTAGLLTGSASCLIVASIDDSWQQAFLAATSVYVSQKTASGSSNTLIQAAQANRAWRLRSLSVAFSVPPAAAVDLQIQDGSGSGNVLWEGYVPANPGPYGAFGGTFNVPIPPIDYTPSGAVTGGIVGSMGNAMTVALSAPGGAVVSTINGEWLPA